MENQLTVVGQIKSVNSNNLVSGDKQVTIKVVVVGAEVEEANKLGNLPHGAMVVVTYSPELKWPV